MAQLAALEAAMGEMEAARATFEAKARRVSDELQKLQQHVEQSNTAVMVQRRAIIGEERKRRRRSGDRAAVSRDAPPNPDAEREAVFADHVNDIEERLQSARRAMARVHNETVRVRAGVDAAKASAAPLCSAGRLAEAKEARNEECSELISGLGFETARGANHDVVLGFFSVIGLWRMRWVSRSFRRWCTGKLASLPRVAAVAGAAAPLGLLADDSPPLSSDQRVAILHLLLQLLQLVRDAARLGLEGGAGRLHLAHRGLERRQLRHGLPELRGVWSPWHPRARSDSVGRFREIRTERRRR